MTSNAHAITRDVIQLGDWRDVLAEVRCDAVICDPPYSAQTHEGSVYNQRSDASDVAGLSPSYTAWSPTDVFDFVHAWSERCRGWIVALTDSTLIPAWQAAYRAVGRYSFQPLPCVMRGMTVRLGGDGPSSWAVYAMVARPSNKIFAAWGTLDGAYVGPRGSESGGGRGKPDWLMRALVRDYSRPDDLVVDPFAGWGATLSAAIGMGRRAIGAEVDAATCNEGNRRIARGSQTDLFA